MPNLSEDQMQIIFKFFQIFIQILNLQFNSRLSPYNKPSNTQSYYQFFSQLQEILQYLNAVVITYYMSDQKTSASQDQRFEQLNVKIPKIGDSLIQFLEQVTKEVQEITQISMKKSNHSEQKNTNKVIEKKQKQQDSNNSEKSPILNSLNSLSESFSFNQSTFKSSIIIDPSKIYYKLNIIGKKQYQILENGHKNLKQQLQKQIPTLENQPIDIKAISVQQFLADQSAWDKLDQISKENPQSQIPYMLYRQILNFSGSIEDSLNSEQVKSKITEDAKDDQNTVQKIMLALQQYLKQISQQIQVIFCQKSSLQSQISMKVISTGFSLHKFTCYQILKGGQIPLTFQDIASEVQNFTFFQQSYKKHLSFKYKIKKLSRITSVSKLQKGALGIQWQTFEPDTIASHPQASKRIKTTPYFKKFYICLQDFDLQRGNIVFPDNKQNVQFRGNWPYYQPQKCQRASIKVWDKFDSKNNSWLTMKNLPNQWPSAYLGLCHQQIINNKDKVIEEDNLKIEQKDQQSIYQLKKTLRNKKCLNKNQIAGDGIFCSPHFWNALKNAFRAKINMKEYVLVVQCRLNPKKIKICERQQIWCVNSPSDIRPYGIILIQQQIRQVYQNPIDQFDQKFTYQKYKQRIGKSLV